MKYSIFLYLGIVLLLVSCIMPAPPKTLNYKPVSLNNNDIQSVYVSTKERFGINLYEIIPNRNFPLKIRMGFRVWYVPKDTRVDMKAQFQNHSTEDVIIDSIALKLFDDEAAFKIRDYIKVKPQDHDEIEFSQNLSSDIKYNIPNKDINIIMYIKGRAYILTMSREN